MLDEAALTPFRRLTEDILSKLDGAERDFVSNAIAARPTQRRTYGFGDLGAQAVSAVSAIAREPDDRASLMSRALVAHLASNLPDALDPTLPPRVFERADTWLGVLLPFLREGPTEGYSYPADAFLKDYRFVTGMTVPCGAQVVDLAERPGLKSVMALASRNPSIAWRAYRAPWFRPHTESRYLDEFNEEGWERCYAEIVDLLEIRSDVAGLVATSWFYDPEVSEISPRLSYLRQTPVSHGALLIRHGTSAFDIQSATATSETRRKLYEQGRYMPECWSIIWPRSEMIEWRARTRG